MDFREAIAKNKRMTRLVILCYLMIMTLVGILADVAMNASYEYDLIALRP